MAHIELFSARQKRLNGELPDVFEYDEIPEKLRVQISIIVGDTLGREPYTFGGSTLTGSIFEKLHNVLCKEIGRVSFPKKKNIVITVLDYFLSNEDFAETIDMIELFFRMIDSDYVRENHTLIKESGGATQSPSDAIKELNDRFRILGIGYQYASGEILRVDSEFIHSEVVMPALKLLDSDRMFDGALNEFLSAHSHYRHGRYKEALIDCNKSFESLMKGICTKHSWEFDKKDAAKKLIAKCIANDLVPKYMQAQFGQFQALLESGVPTIRNKEAGHGQGESISDVPVELASYTLHLTATNIVFLAECSKKIS